MSKETFLILAGVLFLSTQFSGVYAQPNCGSGASCPANCGGSASYSQYTYCTTDGNIVPCQNNLPTHPASCCLCSTSYDNCDSGWYYSIYDENKNLIDPGGCTGPDQTCPPVPCQTSKRKNIKRKVN